MAQEKPEFEASEAHRHVDNLTPEQAQMWARHANGEFERRLRLSGGKMRGTCRQMAVRSANTKFVGGRPYAV